MALDDPKWKEAMLDEMRELEKNKTWELLKTNCGAVGFKVRGGPRLYTLQLRGIEGLGWKVSWWLVRGLSRMIGLALPA